MLNDVYRMKHETTVFCVCPERNYRIFQKKERSTEMIIRTIIQEIYCESSMQSKLGGFIAISVIINIIIV